MSKQITWPKVTPKSVLKVESSGLAVVLKSRLPYKLIFTVASYDLSTAIKHHVGVVKEEIIGGTIGATFALFLLGDVYHDVQAAALCGA